MLNRNSNIVAFGMDVEKEREQTNPTDGGYGWVVVVAAIFLQSSMIPIILCFGIIYEEKFSEMNIPASHISFLLHLHNSLMCLLGLFSGPLLEMFKHQHIIFTGVILNCTALFLTTFADSYMFLIFTVGVMLGLGNGITTPTIYMVVNSYFKKRLTLAMSFQITGASISGIIMPQICSILLDNYSITGTVLVFTGIALNAIPAAMLIKPAKGVVRGKLKNITSITETETTINEDGTDKLLPYHTESIRIEGESKKSQTKNFLKEINQFFHLHLFTSRTYVIIVIGMGISFAAELNTVLMVPFVLRELSNFNTNDLATSASILSCMDLIGRLVVPYIAYKGNFHPKVSYALALLGSTIGRTLLSLCYGNKQIVVVSVGLFGLSKGAKAVFQSIILPKYIPYEILASANGLLMVTNGILSLIVGPIIGVMHDVTNSYVYSLHCTSIISMCCIILWTLDYLLKNPTSENTSTPCDSDETNETK